MDNEQTLPVAPSPRRIHVMDELRGFAVVLMVLYHGFYTLGYLYDIPWGQAFFQFFMPLEPFFAGVFIFICGISCRLSHNNVRRGGLLLLVALAVTLMLWLFLPAELILFGILHFLAVSILLFTLLRPLLDRVPPLAGLLVCALLLLLTWWVPDYQGGMLGIPGLLSWSIPQAILKNNALFALGFGNWQSADYFPLIPWVFCFIAGSFFGVWAKLDKLPAWMYQRRVPFLSWTGRHSLLIYIVHQPLIYGAAFVADALIRELS